MALIDAIAVFWDDQTMTTSGTTIAATQKTLDWGATDLEMGAGSPIWLNIRVGTTAITAGTAEFRLLADTSSGGQDSGSKTVLSSGTRTTAQMTAGSWILRAPLPYDVDDNQYLAVAMVASSSTPQGKVDAWLDYGPQSSYDTQVTTSNI